MTALIVASAVAVMASGWAVWVRRHSFGSRWDAAITAGVALYGLASALDSPWPAVSAASFPLTGKYYLLPAVGQICYLAGTAAGLKSVYVRLLPDDEIDRFMRTRIIPVVCVAAVVMLVCVIASPITSIMVSDYLYRVPLDGWLRVYFATFFLTMTALLWGAVYGAFRLRREPDAGAALPLTGTASAGSLACLLFLAAILTGRSELVPMVIWPLGFLMTTVASLVCASTWRSRIAELTRPPQRE